MFIEELIIDGFKSYSTRVTVGPFDKQFNAITGLNGSGKSNILDSICFVLGISNLSHVRVGNLSELVYKQGQAGVTKATVTVVFNNDDRTGSPVGYEDQKKITITRQIVIGGRNRYILNTHNVQANTIQNLFHSVSLNVNNPHFLIMQGRITKVINMKPQETLSMIEEAAGTRMYENKKAGALKTLEKKQNKVDEINRLLSEEITPTLEKLQRERHNYMLWISNNNELERLTRFCVAYEYMRLNNRLENRNQQLEEFENGLKQLAAELQALSSREFAAKKEMEERTKAKDSDKSLELKALEDEQSQLLKDNAGDESKIKNRAADLKKQVETRNKQTSHLEGMRKQVADKDKIFQKEKTKFDALNEEDTKAKQDIEKAQWSMQALTAGMSTKEREEGEGEGKSLREELLATQTRRSEIESDQKKKTMAIAHMKDRIATAQQSASNSKSEGKRLAKEKGSAENLIKQKAAELEKLHFNPEQHATLTATFRQAESAKHALQEKVDSLRAHLSGIDFQYADPHRGFDRSKVKGVVAKLFHIKPEHASYHRALEIGAGGRLYNVIVDDANTACQLIDKGQLRRRVTIIPLNKIQDHSIHPGVVRQAKSIAPQGSQVESALEIIGYEHEIQKAMKYVFGGTLVCDSPDVAKKVTFHPNVRVRSVTKEGDVYDPAGTVTGGSAPRGGDLLMRLQQLNQMEKEWEKQSWECQKAREQLERMASVATQYKTVEQELRVKQHELSLIEDRINRSEHHATEQALQEMQAQVTQFEADLKNLPEERKQLDQKAKQLEKDIKSLESSREERIKYFERQVVELKAAKQQNIGKLEKQREKMESVGVELEVMRNELESQENQDQSTGQSHEALENEIKELQTGMEQRQARLKTINETLETLRQEIRKLDDTLGKLANELTTNKQQQEEKELEQRRLKHKIDQLAKDDQESQTAVERMEKEYPWIEKEKAFFGKAGTDFDFEANSYQDNKKRLDQLTGQQKKLSNNINKKAMAMFEKAEQEYKDLLHKRDTILNDKCKIEKVIKGLDEKKLETLRRTWAKVNKDFDSIFSTLLPFTNAKLEAPPGMEETEGLEIKVAFNGVWKQSLTELSGGQRSLLALSLVLALLLFKPAPMYILDEIDSALDLSHTQNIGHMIRTHFPHSQFIIVSLKEGMFNHANVLFRTRFIDGTSTVSRNAIRDENDRVAVPTKNTIEADKNVPLAKRQKLDKAGA